MYTALWAGFVPYLKAKLSIGEDVLGSMILVLGVGSCLSMAIAGKLVENFGCKKVVLLASFIGMLSLAVCYHVFYNCYDHSRFVLLWYLASDSVVRLPIYKLS